MQHLDEGTIHAWLDGELPPAEREAAEAHVASCDECKAAVAEARGFIAASSRILTALDAVPGGVLPASTTSSKARAPARFTISRAWIAAAAVLVLSTATVIAVRPRRDAAAIRVAAARNEAKTAATAPSAALPQAESSAPVAAAPPPKLAGALAEAREKSEDKASTRGAPARKDVAFPASVAKSQGGGKPMIVAQAAPAAPAGGAAADLPAPAPAEAPSSRVADASAPTHDSSANNAYALRAPAAQPDSVRLHRPVALQQLVITGEGLSTSSEKLGVAVAAVETPQLVSRRAEAAGADSVVTTVYTVGEGSVTLIERPSAHDEAKRDAHIGFTDQLAARSRAGVQINSLTWSDSTGRTRTLRGAVSQAELERIKAALFGATP